MTLLLVLAILLPWSVWRQMHLHRITRAGLLNLPLIFAAVGVISMIGTDTSDSPGVLLYVAASLTFSTSLGALRGALIPVWRDADGAWNSHGNRVTIGLWSALIGTKLVLGFIAGATGSLPTETIGEIFLFLGLSFAIQNLVVARRTLARRDAVVTAAR